MRDRTAPEDASDHRGALEDELLALRQAVDARGDQRLDRVGNPLRAVAVLEEHSDGLLPEERVALGLLEQTCAHLERQLVLCEQRIDELLARVARERLELDGRRPHAPAAPV